MHSYIANFNYGTHVHTFLIRLTLDNVLISVSFTSVRFSAELQIKYIKHFLKN